MTATVEGVDVPRDHYGRYIIVDTDGTEKHCTRVTTLCGTLDDSYGLTNWKQRMVAKGLTKRPDLLALAASATDDDKKTLDNVCRQAQEAAAAGAGANVGTALHAMTERVDRGEDFVAPPPWDADIKAYLDALVAYNIQIDPEMMERVVYCRGLGVAGTFDRLVRVHDDPHVIADLKTGQTLHWPSIAMQLACYAHADTIYDPTTKTHTPLEAVDQTHGIVMHLPAGKATCTIWEVDLSEAWEMAQVAARVRAWQKHRGLARPYTSWAPPPASTFMATSAITTSTARADWLTAEKLAHRIRALRDLPRAALAATWPPGIPTFTSDHAHNDTELALINHALSTVEADFNVPL